MADAAVHPAGPDDLADIARIQYETWQHAYADLLPPLVLAELDPAELRRSWEHALRHGPARLFVATEGGVRVGFCVAGPAPGDELADPTGKLPDDAASVGLIGTLLVEPRWGRRGHGGRLLATAAAALRADGATRGVTWVPEADTVSLAFYLRAGWATDGMVRTLDAGGHPLREMRLSGTLALTLADPAG